MPRGLGLSHKMREDFLAEVEVKINFRAAPVGVGRERIPNAALIQCGKAHDQLAALNAALMDEFINRPLVGGSLRTEWHRRSVLRFHHRRRKNRMCWTA